MTECDGADVVIVGAGPVGMALAIALVGQGVRPIIFDKQPAGTNTSRAAVLHARTLEVLAPLGVTQELLPLGVRVSTFRVRDRDRLLLEIGFERLQTAYPFTLMCPQDVTETVLLDRLTRVGIEVVRPAELTAVRTVADGVEIDFTQAGDSRMLAAKWVVGCDGGHSPVRTAAGIAFEGAAYAEDFVLADVHMEWPLGREEVDLFFSAEGLVVVAPLPNDRYRIVATVDQAPHEISVAFLQELIQRRGLREHDAQVHDLVWTSRFHLSHRVAQTPWKERTLLCGDAAHVHSPAGGQGMNTGIQDAVSLATPLAEAVKSGKTGGLEAWSVRRHHIARDVVALTDRMTKAATLKGGAQRIVRNTILSIVNQIPLARGKIARTLAELDY